MTAAATTIATSTNKSNVPSPHLPWPCVAATVAPNRRRKLEAEKRSEIAAKRAAALAAAAEAVGAKGFKAPAALINGAEEGESGGDDDEEEEDEAEDEEEGEEEGDDDDEVGGDEYEEGRERDSDSEPESEIAGEGGDSSDEDMDDLGEEAGERKVRFAVGGGVLAPFLWVCGAGFVLRVVRSRVGGVVHVYPLARYVLFGRPLVLLAKRLRVRLQGKRMCILAAMTPSPDISSAVSDPKTPTPKHALFCPRFVRPSLLLPPSLLRVRSILATTQPTPIPHQPLSNLMVSFSPFVHSFLP